jgi:PAS domain S-box-containing protein
MVVAMSQRKVYQIANVIRKRIGTTKERDGDVRRLLLTLIRYLDMEKNNVNVTLKQAKKEAGKKLVHCRLEREYKLSSNDAILLVEPETLRILYANAGAEHLYGYTNKEWLSKTIYDFSLRNRKDIDKEFKMRFGGKSDGCVSRHRLANGKTKAMSANVEPIEREGKKMLFCVINEAIAVAC